MPTTIVTIAFQAYRRVSRGARFLRDLFSGRLVDVNSIELCYLATVKRSSFCISVRDHDISRRAAES